MSGAGAALAEAAPLQAEHLAGLLDDLRARAPQIHALTSTVAQNFTANMLLALGAQPSMSQAPGEIEAFAQRTDALLVNLGMLDAARREAISRALPTVAARGIAWVLDPVKIERSPQRAAFARELLATPPAVLRVNAAEAGALEDWPLPGATVVALSGAVDVVRHGARHQRLRNGHAWMAHVTAMGCAGTGVIAAFTAVAPTPYHAALAGLATLGVAGDIAAQHARGPGSFVPALLDALFHLTPTELAERMRLA